MKLNKENLTRLLSSDNLIHHFLLLSAFFIAFLLRIMIIDQYGLSEDEVLKALATRDYRNFDFSTNAQHPALMKLIITVSTLLLGENEFALRLPNVLITSLTVYPIFYLGSILYDKTVGYFSAFLWAFSIQIIAFSTTVKEDSLFTFLLILTIYYFVKSYEDKSNLRMTGIFLGLTIASKYIGIILIFILLGIHAINRINQEVNSIKSISKVLIPVSLVVFFVVNFPIFLPDTIQNLYDHYFLEKKIAPPRSGFIMMDNLFPDRPFYYLLLFFVVKIPIPIIFFLTIGILEFGKKRNKSNHIISIWILIPLVLFSFLSGYIRYLMIIMPAIFIITANGILKFTSLIMSILRKYKFTFRFNSKKIISTSIVTLVCLNSLFAGLAIAPYYRMYVNELGGGDDKVGYYFPQDSVYDFKFKEAIEYINNRAEENSIVATHIPIVAEYYGREDLQFIFVLDLPTNVSLWESLNVTYVIIQESRTYKENQVQMQNLRLEHDAEMVFSLLETVVVEIYKIQS